MLRTVRTIVQYFKSSWASAPQLAQGTFNPKPLRIRSGNNIAWPNETVRLERLQMLTSGGTVKPQEELSGKLALAQSHWAQGRIADALSLYSSLGDLAPEYLPAQYDRIKLFVFLGRNMGAVRLADKILGQNTADDVALTLKGYALLNMEYQFIGEAKKCFHAAGENHSAVRALELLRLLEEGQDIPFDQTAVGPQIDLSRLVIARKYKYEAQKLGALRKRDEAMKMYETVLEIAPYDERVLSKLAGYYSEKSELDKAGAFIQRLLEIDHPANKVMAVDVVIAEARKQIANRDFKVAEDILLFALRVRPDNKAIQCELAYLQQMARTHMKKNAPAAARTTAIRRLKTTVNVGLAQLEARIAELKPLGTAGDTEATPEINSASSDTLMRAILGTADPESLQKEFWILTPEQLTRIGSLLSIAEGLRSSGRLKEALEHFAQVLEVDPYNTTALQCRDECNEKLLAQAKKKSVKKKTIEPGRGFTLADLLRKPLERPKVEENEQPPAVVIETAEDKRAANRKREERLNPMMTQARQMMNRGNLQAAVQVYRRILAVDPDFMQALIALGSLFLKQNKTKEARKCFEKVLKKHPDNSNALKMLAQCCRTEGDIETAIGYLKRSLSKTPDEHSSIVLLVEYYLEIGKPKELLVCLEGLLQQKTDNHAVLRALGDYYSQFGENEKAIQYLLKAIEINPKDSQNNIYLGKAYREANLFTQALDAFNKVLQVVLEGRWQVGALVGIGHTYLRMLKMEEAREQFEKALKLAPRDASAHYGLARYYYFTEDFSKALQMIENICRHGTLNVSYRNLRGDILRKLGRIEESIHMHEEVLATISSQKVMFYFNLMEKMNAYNSLGACYLAVGLGLARQDKNSEAVAQLEKAQAMFDKAVLVEDEAKGRKKARTYYNMGYVQLALFEMTKDKGFLDKALKRFEEALAIQPNNEHALEGRANCKIWVS